LLGLLVVSKGAAQAPREADQEVLDLDQALIDALFKKDRATFEPLLADDYVYIHSNGTVTNREEEIAQTMASDVKWTASMLSSLKIRVYGDAAIVTGTLTHTGSAKGYVGGARLVTHLWVKRNGRWQTVGGQSTIVPAT
jgi:ketosteroid isomerase-like protein